MKIKSFKDTHIKCRLVFMLHNFQRKIYKITFMSYFKYFCKNYKLKYHHDIKKNEWHIHFKLVLTANKLLNIVQLNFIFASYLWSILIPSENEMSVNFHESYYYTYRTVFILFAMLEQIISFQNKNVDGKCLIKQIKNFKKLSLKITIQLRWQSNEKLFKILGNILVSLNILGDIVIKVGFVANLNIYFYYFKSDSGKK